MAVYSIGAFTFVSLRQVPRAASQRQVILSRPGVPGVAIWRNAVAGRPFQLQSLVDPVDIPTAEALLRSYETLQDSAPVNIVWDDLDFASRTGHNYVVLAVEPVELRETLLNVGGLNSGSLTRLRCLWTLIPVTAPP